MWLAILIKRAGKNICSNRDSPDNLILSLSVVAQNQGLLVGNKHTDVTRDVGPRQPCELQQGQVQDSASRGNP